VTEKQAEELEALMVLCRKVYIPAFVKRCTELGLPISTEADLRSALDVAAILKMSQTSSASAVHQVTVEALRKAAKLPTDAGQHGQTEVEAAVKGAADDPAVRKTMEVLCGRLPRKGR